jgi:DNA-binding transcriptional regulator YiaG
MGGEIVELVAKRLSETKRTLNQTTSKEHQMNIAQVLKAEISRISKREAKSLITPIRKSSAKIKPDIADLKNRLALLEKEYKRLNVLVINLASTQPAPTEAPSDDKARFTGKGVKAMRKKTGLSQKEFGKLTGVSTGAVVQWERKKGVLKLRDATKKAIMAVRGIGKVEARKRLDAMVVKKSVKVAAKKKAVKRAVKKSK